MRKREIHVRFNSVDFCYKNLNNLKCYIQYRGKIYRTFRNQERLQYMYTSRCLINTFVKQKVETLKENNNSKKHFSELKCFYRNIKTQPCLGKRGWSKLSLISRSAPQLGSCMGNLYNTIILFEISKFIQITVFCHPKPCSQQCLRLSIFRRRRHFVTWFQS